MKSKVLAALVATMAVGATCAFAANPFVDVPSDSWAYKSVVELADAGIIQGVDGEHFQGQRNITRYEAAEMVAKAMAHMDKASVEQRALINKLADEFADELNNLGVRVSALENRVGNVKLTGDARVRYRYQKDSKENDASWDYRVRLRANAMVNKNTKVTYGISTGNHSFADNGKAEDENDILSDIAKVDYNFGGGDWTLSVGRTDKYVIGGSKGYGYNYGDIFDRAELKYSGDSFMATAGYGKFKAGGVAGLAADSSRTVLPDGLDGTKTAYGVIEGRFGNGTAIGGYYNTFDNDDYNALVRGTELDYLWGAYASLNFSKDWNLLANYERVNYNSNINSTVRGDEDSATVWIGRLTYGKAVMATPKTWDAWVEYLNAEDGAYIGGSTNSWRWGKLDNLESWGAGIDYTFAKNAQFQVMQSFASKVKDGDGSDPEEQTRAQFVFAF
ncbi:S-layer homology domain-containing protein [Megasphaera sp. DISK 18]|uniref:S-layer homology domain-containing protein n=1 Tax=Megasphaera sp. DISK 18 TaxID=1776081 RepID=UPI000806FB98|nr:S-layer homology domain-containing protein [Megasphaera sp. DISK 18]OBZ33993.1 outer membrane insertion signal [Megasphaera sp. DISK 18]